MNKVYCIKCKLELEYMPYDIGKGWLAICNHIKYKYGNTCNYIAGWVPYFPHEEQKY